MTTIIKRSALVFHGHNPPPDVAEVVIDPRYGRRVVTWAEIIEQRRQWQRERLDRIRFVPQWRPYKVWVAYYDMDLFGGWHAFIENRNERIWIDRDRSGLIPELMKLRQRCRGRLRVSSGRQGVRAVYVGWL